MFRQIYEIALALFLLQGVLIPVLLLASGLAWFRQMARLSVVEKALVRDRKKHGKTLESMLGSIRRLQPLNCVSCGSAVALEARSARCVSCRAVCELPEDYRVTSALRRTLARLSAAAARHWRIARVLTSTPARWFFRLMIPGEPALFVVVLIGAATYRDTYIDRAFEYVGESWAFALMLMAFGGFILWMIVFIFLAGLAKDLRRGLTAFPDVRRAELGAPEYATCSACGGGITIAAGSFAGLCGYCAVANFRADYARRERALSEEQQVLTRESLFGAMKIIEDFVGTFFVTMAILSLGFAILIVVAALQGD